MELEKGAMTLVEIVEIISKFKILRKLLEPIYIYIYILYIA